MRKDFILPESDVEYLVSLGLPWETLKEANNSLVLIHSFPVPKEYTVSEVTVALIIHPGYPISQIDMAYFYPHLQLRNQKTIGAINFHPIDGKVFQRWSRHRTGANPWRPGLDDLSTHLSLVKYWIKREIK